MTCFALIRIDSEGHEHFHGVYTTLAVLHKRVNYNGWNDRQWTYVECWLADE